jgi:hypothetical protein
MNNITPMPDSEPQEQPIPTPTHTKYQKLNAWVRDQWQRVRGNAEWDGFKWVAVMGVAALWVVVWFLRQGPAWQVYGLMGMATAALLVFLCFNSKTGRLVSAVLGCAFIVLFVTAVVSFYQSEKPDTEARKSVPFVGSNSNSAAVLGNSNVTTVQGQTVTASNIVSSPAIQGNVTGHNVQIGGSNNTINSVEVEDTTIRDFKVKLTLCMSGKWMPNLITGNFMQQGQRFVASLVQEGMPIDAPKAIKMVTPEIDSVRVSSETVVVSFIASIPAGEFPLGQKTDILTNYTLLKFRAMTAYYNVLQDHQVIITGAAAAFIINGVENTNFSAPSNIQFTVPIPTNDLAELYIKVRFFN